MLGGSNRRLVCAAALSFAVIGSSSCSKPAPAPAASAPAPAAPSTEKFGPMKPVVSVKEFMEYGIDPISDNIFDAVQWRSTKEKGFVEIMPKTDEDWDKVKVGAVMIAEGIYLLKVPRPFAPEGDVNNSVGPNAPELSPTQIQAKVDQDPVLWQAKIEGLRNAALEVLEIAKKKDASKLFDAGGDLDEACEACHLEYWYPGDKADVEMDKKARQYYVKPAKPGAPDRSGTPIKK